MRLALIAGPHGPHVTVEGGRRLHALKGAATIAEAMAIGPGNYEVAFEVDPCKARLLPLTRPTSKIVCAGLNYRAHIREMGQEVPNYPTLFSKYPDTMVGPFDPIALPAVTAKLDWEVELAVVVGAPLRAADVPRATAACSRPPI